MDSPDNGNGSSNHPLDLLNNGVPTLPSLPLSTNITPSLAMVGFPWMSPFYYPMAQVALFQQVAAAAAGPYGAQFSAWAYAANEHGAASGLFLPPTAMAMTYGSNASLNQYSLPISSVGSQQNGYHSNTQNGQMKMKKKKSSSAVRRQESVNGDGSSTSSSPQFINALVPRRPEAVKGEGETNLRPARPAAAASSAAVVKREAPDYDVNGTSTAVVQPASAPMIKRERREKSPSSTPVRESIVVGDYSNPFEGSQSKMRDVIDLYRFLWLMDEDSNISSRPVYRPFLLRNLCYMQRKRRRKSDETSPLIVVPHGNTARQRSADSNGTTLERVTDTPKNLVKNALQSPKLQPQRYVTESGELTGELLATTVKFNFIRNNLCFGDRSAVVQCYHVTEIDCRPGTIQRIPSARFEMRVNEKLRHVSIYLPDSFGAEFCIGQQSRSEHFIVKVVFRYADSEVGGGKRLRKMASRERSEDLNEIAAGRRRRSNEVSAANEEVVMFGTKPIVSYSKGSGLSVLHGETSIVLYSSSELNIDSSSNSWTRNPSFLAHIQRLQRKTFDNPFMSVQVHNEGDEDEDDNDDDDEEEAESPNDKRAAENGAVNRHYGQRLVRNERLKPGRRKRANRPTTGRKPSARGGEVNPLVMAVRKRRRGPSLSKTSTVDEPGVEDKPSNDASNAPSVPCGNPCEDHLLLNNLDDVFSRGEMALPEMIALRFENTIVKTERKKLSSGGAFFGMASAGSNTKASFSDDSSPPELFSSGKMFAFDNAESDDGGGCDFVDYKTPPPIVVRVLKTAQLCFFCLNRLAFRSLNGMIMHLRLCHSRLKFAFEEYIVVSKNLTLAGFVVTLNPACDVSSELDPMRHYIKHGTASGLTRIRHITVPIHPIWITIKQISRSVRRSWTSLERSTKQAELYNSSLFKDALMTGEIRLGARYTFQPPTKIDQQWIVQANYRKLGEITDLHPCEQAIMQMWNEFLLRIRITLLGHDMVYRASRVFVDEHRDLINSGGLRVYFLLHLVNLSNIGCITDEERYDLFQRLDRSYNPLTDDVHYASRLLDTFNRERVRSSFKRGGDVTACRTSSSSNLQQLLIDHGTPESGGGSAPPENCMRNVAHFESFEALRAAFPTASIRRLEKLWRFLDVYTIASFKMI